MMSMIMTTRWIILMLALLLALPLAGQDRSRGLPGPDFGRRPRERMPDGRSRTLMILKKDAEKSREDMAKVVELATELRDEVEQNEFHTVDLGSVRKAEEIIKLVKRVKSRLSKAQ